MAHAHYHEDSVLTPRDSREQRAIRSGYTGPKNNRGEPDTTGTDKIGVMIYPPYSNYKHYSGQWRNGEFNGQGTVIFKNDDTYTGGWNDSELNGRGVYKHSNGFVREGEFVDDLQVRGTVVRPDYTFQGTFLSGREHTGTTTYTNGIVFRGRREQEDMKRVGTFKYPDGDIFSGTFENQNGFWVLHGDDAEMIANSVPNKFIYKGQMRNGVRHGLGTMQIMSGPRMGERYSAKFDKDVEVKGSRENLPKQGGTRHKRTRCRHKKLRMSRRYEQKGWGVIAKSVREW